MTDIDPQDIIDRLDEDDAEVVQQIIEERDLLRHVLADIRYATGLVAVPLDTVADALERMVSGRADQQDTDRCPRCGAELPAEGGEVALCLCPACGCRVCEGGV